MIIKKTNRSLNILFSSFLIFLLSCENKVNNTYTDFLRKKGYVSNDVNNVLSLWSPDGSKIAFMVRGSYFEYNYAYIMNSDGTNKKRIGSIDTNYDISWSEDSKKIILTMPSKNKRGLQIYDLNGKLFFEQVMVDDGRYLPLEEIQWRKDKIIWSLYGKSFMVSITNFDENNLRLNIPTDYIEGGNPILSPDGKKVIFTNNNLKYTKILDLETKVEKKIDTIYSSYLWNKDSNKILLTWYDKDKKTHIEIYDSLKNESKQIYSFNGSIFSIFWSSDEKNISFIAKLNYEKDKNNIYNLDVDTLNLVNITQNKYEIGDYSYLWSPKGDKIAFTKPKDSYYKNNVWVMNSDGSNQKRLTDNTYSLYAYKNYAYIEDK